MTRFDTKSFPASKSTSRDPIVTGAPFNAFDNSLSRVSHIKRRIQPIQEKKDNKNDRGNKDNKNDKQKEQEKQQGQISKEDAQRLLDALQNDEKNLQDKMKKAKAKGVKVDIEKDW